MGAWVAYFCSPNQRQRPADNHKTVVCTEKGKGVSIPAEYKNNYRRKLDKHFGKRTFAVPDKGNKPKTVSNLVQYL